MNGSGDGIQGVIDGKYEIGHSSRDLKDEEKAEGLTGTAYAIDGIALVINNENTASNLTKEQVKGIYTGEITNWSEVGGADAPITVVILSLIHISRIWTTSYNTMFLNNASKMTARRPIRRLSVCTRQTVKDCSPKPLSKILCVRKKPTKKKRSKFLPSACEPFFPKAWTHKRRKISLYGLANITVSIFATVTEIRDRRCAYGI